MCLQLLENDEIGVNRHTLKCVTEKAITLSDPLFKLTKEVTRVGFYNKNLTSICVPLIWNQSIPLTGAQADHVFPGLLGRDGPIIFPGL